MLCPSSAERNHEFIIFTLKTKTFGPKSIWSTNKSPIISGTYRAAHQPPYIYLICLCLPRENQWLTNILRKELPLSPLIRTVWCVSPTQTPSSRSCQSVKPPERILNRMNNCLNLYIYIYILYIDRVCLPLSLFSLYINLINSILFIYKCAHWIASD